MNGICAVGSRSKTALRPTAHALVRPRMGTSQRASPASFMCLPEFAGTAVVQFYSPSVWLLHAANERLGPRLIRVS